MIFNLEKFFGAEGESTEFEYGFDMDDPEFPEPVSVSGRIYNKTGIVNLEATAAFRRFSSCALCNKDIVYEQKLPVRHILVTGCDEDSDDDLYIVVESMQFELNSLISEDIYLSLPARLLCKDDCKGLCPMCGTDLNTATCNCKKPTDPRWDVLSDLFK